MFDSKEYWNQRYINGQNSGAGSYNELVLFKADIINDFIEQTQIKSIIDYGVGDGNQLTLINTNNIVYTGIDVSEFIVSKLREKFNDDNTKKFIHINNIDNDLKAELVLSCDVIYHLIEDDVYEEYMEKLFSMSDKYVIIYARNENKNHVVHVKFRKFSNYIENNLQEWNLIKHIPNKYPQIILGNDNDITSPSDFYIYEKNDMFLPTIHVPVYISLTSIFKNQEILLQTLQSIVKQSKIPDKIFLYLSEDPYILDDGFKDKKITNSNLLKLINDNSMINISWVKNTGPYRKLLPILKDKWEEDCIIITIDDDTIYENDLIKNLVNDYYEHKCVVGYRGFTPKFDKLEHFDYEKRDKLQNLSLYNFLTGKGGVLYKPEFFHKTKDLIFNDKIYSDTCDKQDDIWFYIVRILNDIKCYTTLKEWHTKDISAIGLYSVFNSKNNNNTLSFTKTIQKLKELHYM